jgi:hypothetical protein
MINHLKNYCTMLLAGTLALSLSSCASSLANPKSSISLPTTEVADASLTNQLDSTSSKPAKALQEVPVSSQPLKATKQTLKTITINLYQADTQCQGLVAKKVAISSDNSVDQAVQEVLKQTDSADFNLAGYRVNVNPKNKIATVDLRLPPKSKRQFTSLSNCEQLALFGSMRKTLKSNPKLNVKDVKFTNQGSKITF